MAFSCVQNLFDLLTTTMRCVPTNSTDLTLISAIEEIEPILVRCGNFMMHPHFYKIIETCYPTNFLQTLIKGDKLLKKKNALIVAV